MMSIRTILGALAALLASLLIAWVLLAKEGGCDRSDVPDEDPEPAGNCKPTDEKCKVDEPAPPPAPPPIGGQ